MTGSSRISHRERVFLRSATLLARRQGVDVTKTILKEKILAANNSNESSVTLSKISSAVDTKKHCYGRPSNQYFFIPYGFGIHFVRALLPNTLLRSLIQVVGETESNFSMRNIRENLVDSDVAMWYLENNNDVIGQVCDLVSSAYKTCLHVSGRGNQWAKRTETIEIFEEFVSKSKIPSTVTYLKYEQGKIQGCVDHQDVDSIFCTGLLYLKDTTRGRLHVANHDLPEFFSPGDLLLMDPCQIHSVTKLARDEVRQVMVFTM